MTGQRKVVISVGPIPARLDSVKFITNRFRGGLAVKTAEFLAGRGHELTVVAWSMTANTALLDLERHPNVKEVVRVRDVFEYYDWFVAHAKDYDAFVMAAAVANLTPVHPFEGKFPSHDYRPGDEFDIRFMIAPRAIDAIKALNPRACLIGYKLFDAATDQELVDIARHTLSDARANIIFANTPADAKSRKLAVMADNSVVPCTFDEHMELIDRAVSQQYFHTNVTSLSDEEAADPDIREAMATVSMYEKTFNGFGTVAVPVANSRGMFVTTARGHRAGPVLVRSISRNGLTVNASGKATLNAPALASMLRSTGEIIIHRHETDPMYDLGKPEGGHTVTVEKYLFPGTLEESDVIRSVMREQAPAVIVQPFHGYLKRMPIRPVDWSKYHEQFPDKYFGTPEAFRNVLRQFVGERTLEVGGNDSPDAMFSYDPYVKTDKAINLTWGQVLNEKFDLVFARNAVNYLTLGQIQSLVERTGAFIANTFLNNPAEKVCDNEAAVADGTSVRHTLRLPDDSLVRHTFHWHSRADYEWAGLTVIPYGRNSALVVKGLAVKP